MRDPIRTTSDVLAPLYRKLKERAAQRGCSVRDLLLSGAEREQARFPLIASKGPKVTLSNERLYELIEFP